jgi:hypothetical protein
MGVLTAYTTQIIMNIASGKLGVSVVAGSSIPQWIYDASYSVTASNLVLARILTDTLISRSPHCVLGARYDANVNLFYVVMAGDLANRGSRWYFLVQTLSAAVALRGATQEYSARAVRDGAVPPERAAVYTGIKAWPSSPWPAAFQAPNRSVQEKSLLRTESLKIIREWN